MIYFDSWKPPLRFAASVVPVDLRANRPNEDEDDAINLPSNTLSMHSHKLISIH